MSENACFFQLLLTIKVKVVDKMMQTAYLCVIMHAKREGTSEC